MTNWPFGDRRALYRGLGMGAGECGLIALVFYLKSCPNKIGPKEPPIAAVMSFAIPVPGHSTTLCGHGLLHYAF